jgi:hypothetical protein
MLISSGLGPLLEKRLEYFNYRGAVVFAPFALLMGALAIFAAIVGGRRK